MNTNSSNEMTQTPSDKVDEQIAALQKFKDYVHKRLDDAGIPTHPDGEHSKHGCRIGDRLDMVLRTTPSQQGIFVGLDDHDDSFNGYERRVKDRRKASPPQPSVDYEVLDLAGYKRGFQDCERMIKEEPWRFKPSGEVVEREMGEQFDLKIARMAYEAGFLHAHRANGRPEHKCWAYDFEAIKANISNEIEGE